MAAKVGVLKFGR